LKKFLYTNSFYTLDEYFDESWHALMSTLIIMTYIKIPHYIGVILRFGYLSWINPILL
jgi:hypothetical protein